MRIAQVAPLTEAIPPKLYGGTERVVHWLTEELVALGNDVTLFASGDSRTTARLEATWPKALRLDGSIRDPNALHIVMLERVRQLSHEFDLLHFHLDYYPFSLFARQQTPFITTLHGRLSDHAARPARFAGAPAGVPDISHDTARFNLKLTKAARPAGELGRDDLSWGSREIIDATSAGAGLPRSARSYRTRKID